MSAYKALALLTALSATFAADAAENAGTPDDWPMPMHTPGPYWMVLADRLESHVADGSDAYVWDLQGWYGYDFNRLRWKTEGEGEAGESPEEAEVQLLFSHLFAPYWEWQLGLRHDFEPGDGLTYAVAGIQGVAPYEFELDAAMFLSEDGDALLRFEAEYDLLLTQRLILQPRLELNAALNDVPEIGVASGVGSSEVGLRLRYEVRREIAPYIGISWSQQYGETADMTTLAGGDSSATSFVAGLRFWF